MTRITQAATRPARTAVQGGVAYAVTELIASFGLLGLDDNARRYAAVLLVLTIVFSWAQTATENRLGVGFLRSVPPRTDAVVDGPDERGAAGLVTIVLLLILVAVVFAIVT